MSLQDKLLPLLRCPKCRGAFKLTLAPSVALAGGEFGVLQCGCGKYPVVDGVPVLLHSTVGMFEHTTGEAQVAGVTPARLVELIEQGHSIDALLECLAFPTVPKLLRSVLGWKLSHGSQATQFGRWLCKKRITEQLLAKRDTVSAVEVFRFFYGQDSPLDFAVGGYFNLRFGQPRHLAALSLLFNVPADGKPMLDIACGGGHLDHYLAERIDPVSIVGTDLNFFHLWIARHWIAPKEQYVCADASEGLPFADASFSATFCSDAYHYIPNRVELHREIERCAPGRLGILTRVGNAEVMPNEGSERTVKGYIEDIGAADARAFAEPTLLRCYLDRRNPFEQAPDQSDVLTRSKWLSFAWNFPAKARDAAVLKKEWPHAAGTLGVNPIYARIAAAAGQMQLRFEFPSTWYAYENNGMLAYIPRRVSLSAAQLDAVRNGRSDESFPGLAASFVLLGMPKRFRPPLN